MNLYEIWKEITEVQDLAYQDSGESITVFFKHNNQPFKVVLSRGATESMTVGGLTDKHVFEIGEMLQGKNRLKEYGV